MNTEHTTNQNINQRKMRETSEYGHGYGQYCILDDYTHSYVIQKKQPIYQLYTITEEHTYNIDSDEDDIQKYIYKNKDSFILNITRYVVATIVSICTILCVILFKS